MAAPSMGYAAQLAIAATGTAIGSYTDRFEFLSITGGESIDIIDTSEEAIRGTRSRSQERVAQGLINVAHTITMNPSPTELDLLLPWILGAAESLDVFDLADALTERDYLIDFGVHRQIFQNAKVNKATFRGSKGQPVSLVLDVIAKTAATPVATAFPAISIDTDDLYVFHQGVLTLRSSAREFSTCETMIDNALLVEHNNSQSASHITAADRNVGLIIETPFSSDEDDLYTAPKASIAGAAGTLVFTNGGKSLTFTYGNLKEEVLSPSINGKTEIRQPLTLRAYKTGSTNELVVTHDSTA